MIDPAYNSSIQNHSLSQASPDCFNSTCHSSGWIHNSTLNKPAFSLPSTAYCQNCHADKQKHNNSQDCSRCHINSTSSDTIHPIKYIQTGGSYASTSTQAANCTNCHQDTGLSGFSAPIVPNTLKHSSNFSNGTIWGTFWTSEEGACYYCHSNTKHNATALGRINALLADSNNTGNGSLTTTTWCADCHYNDSVNINYKGNQWSPNPPVITVNNTGNSNWVNHSSFLSGGYRDNDCKACHALNGTYSSTSLNYSHSLNEGVAGGANCIACHDTGGRGAPDNKRILASVVKQGVHGNLNADATNSSAVDIVSKACWACHGEGTEPDRHPSRYKSPRKCGNNDCHSLSQSFKAPMVYSHFKDAGLNSNPDNAVNYNISTRYSCESCHSNSLLEKSENLNASVAHYATTENLIDSINCMYCHLDRDNAIKWGNATEINKNRTALIEMDREQNKFTAHTGEFVELGLGYRIKVKDISKQRGSAAIELYQSENLIDSRLVNVGQYIYEERRIINNASLKIPVIVLNITAMFISGNDNFMQFEGWRIKRLHEENKTTSCYLCHFNGIIEKRRYTVIDRMDEDIYYTELLLNSSDKEEYDQQQALQILAVKTPKDAYTDIGISRRKTLKEGQRWNIGERYSLTLKDVAANSGSAVFLLEVGNKTYSDIVEKGEIFNYESGINYPGYKYSNITIFRAKVSEISQGKPNIVILEDIMALSPEIKAMKDNSTIYGYNASWLWENSTFLTGRIPANLHSPLLIDGRDGGANCISCHNIRELGFHSTVNQGASAGIVPAVNKACWACHGTGKEPERHPASHKKPRQCKSCHVERKVPFFNATYIGNENHSATEECSPCHVVDKHRIIRFKVTPSIKMLSLSKKDVYAGEEVIINATAVSGYRMSIRRIEYYADSPSNALPMSALDGSFDERVEEATASIDTTGLKPGIHSIYIRAMERDETWGPESTISLVVKEDEPHVSGKSERAPFPLLWFIIFIIIISLLLIISLGKS